jgi:ZIP family zinc transporter
MIWVVSSEIIPETHRDQQEGTATFALMVGFVVMMTLDWIFG